jgi:hypothetical protein
MNSQALVLPRLDRLIWAIVATVAAIVAAAAAVSNFQIAWGTFAPPAAACAALLAAGSFYSRWRDRSAPCVGASEHAQVIAFAAVGAPLSYIAASANLPLHDHALDAVDRALGLDWKGLLDWMSASPLAYATLRPIYLSLSDRCCGASATLHCSRIERKNNLSRESAKTASLRCNNLMQ